MRIGLVPLALSLALWALPLRAQDDGGSGDEQPAASDQAPQVGNGGGGQAPADADGAQQGGDQIPAGGTGAMSVDDARVNMQTLLQSFLAARAVDGYWPLKDKARHGLLKLVPESKTVTDVEAVTDRKFRGKMLFMDLTTKKYYSARFDVDFGGAEWQVVGMTLKPAPKPKAAKKRGG